MAKILLKLDVSCTFFLNQYAILVLSFIRMKLVPDSEKLKISDSFNVNYLAFQSFDWWRLFQKHVIHTKLDIYVLICNPIVFCIGLDWCFIGVTIQIFSKFERYLHLAKNNICNNPKKIMIICLHIQLEKSDLVIHSGLPL
jgi:hypothetical protein